MTSIVESLWVAKKKYREERIKMLRINGSKYFCKTSGGPWTKYWDLF